MCASVAANGIQQLDCAALERHGGRVLMLFAIHIGRFGYATRVRVGTTFIFSSFG